MYRYAGVLRIGSDGVVLLESRNPYPFLRVILTKKVPIFKDFFRDIGPGIIHNFRVFAMQTLEDFGNFGKNGLMLRIIFFFFFFLNMGLMFRNFVRKSYPLERHIPVWLNMWVPPHINIARFVWNYLCQTRQGQLLFVFFHCCLKPSSLKILCFLYRLQV